MHLARHGTGVRADLAALGSQVHPVFMLPPLAVSLFGAVLAGSLSPLSAALHVTAIFLAVYTAHLKDGYVDFHERGEDDDHPITDHGCRMLIVASSLLFFAITAGLWLTVDLTAVLVTVPTWLIAIAHAPQLDMHPVGATAGYPAGIGMALIGGYYVQAGSIDLIAIAFGVVFLVLLSGVKVIDDTQDFSYDRSIAKRTVAVALGPARARELAYSLLLLAVVIVVAFAGIGVFPPSTAVAVLVIAPVIVLTRRAGPTLSTMLLIRSSYLFLAVLVAAVWFRPLAG